MKYNKLVRDNIPGIIEKKGEVCKWHTATEEEFAIALHQKLIEEVEEFKEAISLEELADVMEVVDAIIVHYNFSRDELQEVQEKKKEERGIYKKDHTRCRVSIMDNEPKLGSIYRHYKGNTYEVLLLVVHTETGEEMVVYEDTSDRSKKWTRPLEMFMEHVVIDGVEQSRFTKLEK